MPIETTRRKIDWNRPIELDREFAAQMGLVFACPFKEQGGIIVRDYSGNRYDGTLGASTAAPARSLDKNGGPALTLDGTDDHVDFAATNTVLGSAPFTAIFWSRTSSTAVSHMLSAWGDSASASWAFFRSNGTSGRVQFYTFSNPTAYSVESSATIADGTWQQIAGVYTGSQILLYRNGVSDATPVSASRQAGTSVIRFGSEPSTGLFPHTGDVANVVICNKALTAEQVARLYRDQYIPYWQPSRRKIFFFRQTKTVPHRSAATTLARRLVRQA